VTTGPDPFRDARAVADTVLLEGYVLYPYRASAAKNRMRWQFGVLTPTGYAEAHSEHDATRTECLIDPRDHERVRIEVRFLRVVRRTVEAAAGHGFRAVERLAVGNVVHLPWDEGRIETVRLEFALDQLLATPADWIEALPHARTVELLDPPVGRLVRETQPLRFTVSLSATRLPGPYGVVRLRVDVQNSTESIPGPANVEPHRDEVLRSSLVAAHLLLGLTEGHFLSLAGPPEWARPAAQSCVNEHTWPVLVGAAGCAATDDRARVVLSSPIMLDDHPRIAPESEQVLYDSTEIDEILTLRTLTLTEEEKREARGTDPRAAAIIDAVEGMSPDLLDRLHGAIRSLHAVPTIRTSGDELAATPIEAVPPLVPWWDPGADETVDPEHDCVDVCGMPVSRGARVVLRPGIRGADAQDLFLDGRTATVQAVLHDVDGDVHVAVSVDGDPLAEIQAATGRFRYFRSDELEPLVPTGGEP
jgi:hypothetical protein